MDDEALHSTCHRNSDIELIRFLARSSLGGISAFRWSAERSSHRVSTDLVPCPRTPLCFNYASFISAEKAYRVELSVAKITHGSQARSSLRKVHGVVRHVPLCCGAKGCRRCGGHCPNEAHLSVACWSHTGVRSGFNYHPPTKVHGGDLENVYSRVHDAHSLQFDMWFTFQRSTHFEVVWEHMWSARDKLHGPTAPPATFATSRVRLADGVTKYHSTCNCHVPKEEDRSKRETCSFTHRRGTVT